MKILDEIELEYHIEKNTHNCLVGFDSSNTRDGEEICFIDFIKVDDEHRGKGLARKCLQDLIREMRSRGVHKFYLYAQVCPDDYNVEEEVEEEKMPIILDRVLDLYESLGFTLSSRVEHWSNQVDMYLSFD